MPGTDAALALGMMHVIVEEDLHDEAYLSAHAVGFERLRERLLEYAPDRRGGDHRDRPGRDRNLARAYATTRPAPSDCSSVWSITPTARRRSERSAVCRR